VSDVSEAWQADTDGWRAEREEAAAKAAEAAEVAAAARAAAVAEGREGAEGGDGGGGGGEVGGGDAAAALAEREALIDELRGREEEARRRESEAKRRALDKIGVSSARLSRRCREEERPRGGGEALAHAWTVHISSTCPGNVLEMSRLEVHPALALTCRLLVLRRSARSRLCCARKWLA